MSASTAEATRIGTGAEPVESVAWLEDFAERYVAAWNSRDPEAVVAHATPDVTWVDPALPEPARGHDELAEFVRSSVRAFPDIRFEETGPVALASDSLSAYAPWRMTGTNTGPIEPPGLAATGRPLSIAGVDVWQFRDGLIWRYEAHYDFAEISRQLGLLPPRGGGAEAFMVRAQRLRARFSRS